MKILINEKVIFVYERKEIIARDKHDNKNKQKIIMNYERKKTNHKETV